MAQGVQQSEVDEGLRAVAAALLEAGDRGIGAFGLEGTTALAIFGTSRPDFGVEPRPLRQFRLQPSSTQKFVFILAQDSPPDASSSMAAVAAYLDDRLCVPRDMGLLPAKAIRQLACSLK